MKNKNMETKTKSASQSVIGKIVDLIAGSKPPADPHALLMEYIIDTSGETVVSRADLDTRDKFQGEYQKSFHAANVLFTDDAANKAFHAQHASQQAHARSGKLAEHRSYSREELEQSHRTKQYVAKSACDATCLEYSQFSTPINKRMLDVAESFLAARLAAEKAEAEKFNLRWQPSCIASAAQVIVDRLRQRIAGASNGVHPKPSEQVPYLASK